MPVAPDPTLIAQALSTLYAPADILELRAIYTKGRKRVDAGYFDGEHRQELVQQACLLNRRGASVYVTLNSLDPQLLARCANRVQDYAQATATDANVTHRRWLLIDIDPQRPKDTSATEEQLAIAVGRGQKVRRFLSERGWPLPAIAESGNGLHLLYRVDLPNDDASRDLIKTCLDALSKRYSDEHVKIDQSVFNAARIIKLHGTVANKGDDVPVAPWRLSQLSEVPETLVCVDIGLLQALAAIIPKEQPTRKESAPIKGVQSWTETNVAQFLSRANLQATGPDNHGGVQRWKLHHCPFNPDHGFGEAAVFLRDDGRLGFECRHDSCQDKQWRHLRELVDGKWEDRKPAHSANGAAASMPEDNAPPALTEEELERWAIEHEAPPSGDVPDDTEVQQPKLVRPGAALIWKSLLGREPPEREWIIPYWIPASHVTILSGRGGIGKSLLAQHLGTAIATGAHYIEKLTPKKVLMWAAEDDYDELWRRQLIISSYLESPLDNLDNFILRSCVGVDVTLASPVFNSLAQAPMLAVLREEVNDIKADIVILDNIARLFGGNENDRHQVTTFVAWLQSACAPAAILLLGHPAKAVGSEFSGSTAWEGAVRARLYFSDRAPDEPVEDDAPVDPAVRYLSRRKANYSELDMRKFILRDGSLMPEDVRRRTGIRSPNDFSKDTVLRAVQKLAERDMHGTSSSASPQYLPRLAKQYGLLEDVTESAFAGAMRKLVMDGGLVSTKVGSYSNRTPRMGLTLPPTKSRQE